MLLLDSITDVEANAEAQLAISGSHGGYFPAAVASRAGLRAVVFNDAGVGLRGAGVAGVKQLAGYGMAAAAVDCMSAEIGSAMDTYQSGVVSYANTVAAELGVKKGQFVNQALAALDNAPQPHSKMAALDEARWEEAIVAGLDKVLCVDSASLIKPDDARRIIVTGSHGGLIGGDPARACKAQAYCVFFNDAGIGKQGIGLSRLPALDERKIAAATIDCQSCEIGSAASAVQSGVISHINHCAGALGLKQGMAVADALPSLLEALPVGR